MASHTLTLHGFLPTPLNRLMRIHPAGRHRILATDAGLIALLARQQGVPEARGARRVSARFSQPKGRLADPDARLKALLDELVLARLLLDDGPALCVLGTIESVRGPARKTVLVLEDLGQAFPASAV
jgi:hypothetical protein